MDFDLVRPELGSLTLRADFVPGGQYTVLVSTNESIRDGFGLPLEASSANWMGDDLFHRFDPIYPTVRSVITYVYAVFLFLKAMH